MWDGRRISPGKAAVTFTAVWDDFQGASIQQGRE
jgi:hypothetical protein